MPRISDGIEKTESFSVINGLCTGVLDRGILCFGEEVEHHFPHVMVWEAMNSEHLFEPYFFDGSVNHLNYLAKLENWFMPQKQSLGIESNVWLQQDREPAHLAITVRKYLNEVFPSRWIGRESATLPPPLDWPSRSPDLTTCDNTSWGFKKEKVAQQRYTKSDEFQQSTSNVW